jgi:hypothetical protein
LDPALDAVWREADLAVRAPAGFESRLFARLERESALLVMPEPMPWWVRAAGERHVAFALLVAGALAAWPGWWLAAASPARAGVTQLAAALERFAAPLFGPLLAPFAAPHVGLGLALALAPVLVWGSYELARTIGLRAARGALGRLA